MNKCVMCDKETDELCSGLVCRDCHVSVSWDDCVNRTFDADLALKGGMSLEMAKDWFPNADLDKIRSGQSIHSSSRRAKT